MVFYRIMWYVFNHFKKNSLFNHHLIFKSQQIFTNKIATVKRFNEIVNFIQKFAHSCEKGESFKCLLNHGDYPTWKIWWQKWKKRKLNLCLKDSNSMVVICKLILDSWLKEIFEFIPCWIKILNHKAFFFRFQSSNVLEKE